MLCKIKKFLPWLAVIIWMTIIFLLSHQTADTSSEVSTGLLGKIIEFIGPVVSHNTLRKMAHAFEYFVLSILVFNALWHSIEKHKTKISIYSFLISLLYASSDEIHQIFIEGRAGRIFDVGVDMLGATIGIAMCVIILIIYNNRIKGHSR